MIEDKILKFKRDIDLARKLANNIYADKVYYETMALKLEKILRFYESLKLWNNSNKN